MTDSTAATTTLSMKLLVDTKARRVLFAEAGKDVVDFLFSLLALPIGTVVKLIGQKSMVGSAGDLYRSVEKLDGTYVQPGASKDAILRPVMASSPANSALLDLPAAACPSNRFFKCPSASYSVCRDYVTDVSGTKCPRCSNAMTTQIQYAPPAGSQAAAATVVPEGFVRGVVTYTVMDSLAVSPMSAISSITLLNTFAVTDLTALQEETVYIGYKEGILMCLLRRPLVWPIFFPSSGTLSAECLHVRSVVSRPRVVPLQTVGSPYRPIPLVLSTPIVESKDSGRARCKRRFIRSYRSRRKESAWGGPPSFEGSCYSTQYGPVQRGCSYYGGPDLMCQWCGAFYWFRAGSFHHQAAPLDYLCFILLKGLEILKASLQSKTVLTDVFLGNKSPSHD